MPVARLIDAGRKSEASQPVKHVQTSKSRPDDHRIKTRISVEIGV